MIFPVQLQLGPKKWDHQGTFPVWTEQMLWWWRGAFSSPLAFQRRSYGMILGNPDIHLEDSWRKVSDKSRYISVTELFLGLSLFCFQNIPKQLIRYPWESSNSTSLRAPDLDLDIEKPGLRLLPASLLLRRWRVRRCAAAPRRFRRSARCEHYNP